MRVDGPHPAEAHAHELSRMERRLAKQKLILEAIAGREPFTDVLDLIVALLEEEAGPSVLGSILLFDDAVNVLRPGAAPSLPRELVSALAEIPVAEGVGACGTAAFRREPVFTSDVSTDPLWDDYRHLLAPHGLLAVWSTPILASDRTLLGTFALYSKETGEPSPSLLSLLDLSNSLAALTIQQRNQTLLLKKERDFTSAVIQGAGGLVFVLDRKGEFVRFNRACQQTTGFAQDAVRGRSLWSLVHDEEDARALQSLFESIDSAVFPIQHETKFLSSHGGPRIVQWSSASLPDAQDAVRFVVGTGIDVTERRQAELALRESEERYRELFESNLAGVYRSTGDGRILDCNDSFARILGYESPAEMLALPATALYDAPEHRDAFMDLVKDRRVLPNHEATLVRRDGRTIWVLENAVFREGPGGGMVLGTLFDITDRKRAEEDLQRLAYFDALTNLPNRTLFDDRIDIALAQARYSKQPLAVLFIDLDRFKLVNDSLGHKAGDELLRQASQRLKSCVYESDTVARLGGDEFLLLLPRLSNVRDIVQVLQKILGRFRQPFHVDGREVYATVSMGVSMFPEDGADAETLVKNADTAMYRAKHQGRDRYETYAPSMNEKAMERVALETRLHRAVERGEFVLHYQPIANLASGGIVALEALVRWRHRTQGLLRPDDFIPLAEETGLIVPIGQWILRTACRDLAALARGGQAGLVMTVNLPARPFSRPAAPPKSTAPPANRPRRPSCPGARRRAPSRPRRPPRPRARPRRRSTIRAPRPRVAIPSRRTATASSRARRRRRRTSGSSRRATPASPRRSSSDFTAAATMR